MILHSTQYARCAEIHFFSFYFTFIRNKFQLEVSRLLLNYTVALPRYLI